MTPYEAASLCAQWVGSISAALAVVVAALFGYLTLANSRRSKDTQQRATLVAAFEDSDRSQSLHAPEGEPGSAHFTVRQKAGETWLLINEGPDIAYMVEIEGLTDLDKRRLQEVALDPVSLGAGKAKEFVLVSRLTLSGPANIIVSFRLQPDGSLLRRVLQVPAA